MADNRVGDNPTARNVNRNVAVFIVALVIVATTFFVDTVTPRGVAVGIFPHFFAIAITAWIDDRRAPVLIAILATLAALAGYAVTEGGHFSTILFNRAVLIAAFWCLAYLVLLKQRADQRLQVVNESLEAEVAARTASERLIADRLKLATQTAQIGVWDWDIASDKEIWDERMRELYEVPEHYTGDMASIWRSRVHADDFARVRDELSDAMAGRMEFDSAFRLQRQDGSLRYIEARGLILRNEDGTPRRVIGVNWDVTDRVETAQRLQQSQKLEAVGQLTSGIAHDFNNLLTIVLGNLELMADEVSGNTRLTTLIDNAQHATLRGASLTQRLLAFARVQPLNAEVTDVNEIVDKASALIAQTLGDDIRVETGLANDLWLAVVDRMQLENALLNLAINARDAMPGGGALRIETANVDLPPVADNASGVGRPGPHVVITVSDTGTGMSRDVAENAFQPFFTTKEVGAGSGLGLSMVYGFVSQSGGHIELSSEPGRGTEFRLYFPKSEASASAAPIAPEVGSAPGGGETLLVVEDDADIRAFEVRALERLGYRCIVAEHGPDALEKLNGVAELDLLLTDLAMPQGLNGLQLSDAVRERFPRIRTLLTSANLDSSRAEIPGDIDFLQKPYSIVTLAQAVRRVLDAPARHDTLN